MIYYTADTHFGDADIMRKCGRPFRTVEEMDDRLRDNWNSTVKPGDTVYVVGDVAVGYEGDIKGPPRLAERNQVPRRREP